MSRTAIARATRLTAPTCFAIVEELLSMELVRCVATSRSSRGRPRAIYRFNPSAAFSIGVDISGDSMVGVLIDLSGTVLETQRCLRPPLPEVQQVISWIAAMVENVRASGHIDPTRLAGIGVAVPALIDRASGHVVRSTNLGWSDIPLARMLAEATGIEVYLENAARSIALSERWFGAGRDAEHLACVNVGMGIGMALIINGGLYTGADSQSGELGHTVVEPDGPVCLCGRRGCLEAVASGRAILKTVVQAVREGRPSSVLSMAGGDPARISLDMVVKAADEGDSLCAETVRTAAFQIGLAVSNAITIVNPKMVVLSGSLIHSSRLVFESISETIRGQAPVSPNALETAAVVRARYGPLAAAVGAAGVVHQRRTGLYDGVRVVGA